MKTRIIHAASSGDGKSTGSVVDRGQCDCDCDCACTTISHASFSLDESFVSWQTASEAEVHPLSSGWYGLHNPAGSIPFVLLDHSTYKFWLALSGLLGRDRKTLKDEQVDLVNKMAMMGLVHPIHAGEDQQLVEEQVLLTSWLHLTDRCNLRCSYCYLPHVREDMSSETGRSVVDAIFRSALANGFKQVKMKYAGGEPLLRYPLIMELHRYAQSLADQHDIGLEGVVLSNGTLLTGEMVEGLKSLDLRLMISLDGMGLYHDRHRPYAGGRGSFADVSEAVDLAISHGLPPTISVTVSSRTADGLPDTMAWILERNLPFSLNFYRENELSASHEDMRLDEQKIINGMLAAFQVIENDLPRRPFLGGVVDRANLAAPHTHTCGVGQNYLVFDQNGQVAKCQMHIRKPITNVHAADPLALIRADQIGIQNYSVEEKEGCKTCEWKHWCAGGCPMETYRATGRYDVKSPNCNIYKALFPEVLRLEGLRLLKYQDDPEVVVKY